MRGGGGGDNTPGKVTERPGLSEDQRATRACIGMAAVEVASAEVVGGEIGAINGKADHVEPSRPLRRLCPDLLISESTEKLRRHWRASFFPLLLCFVLFSGIFNFYIMSHFQKSYNNNTRSPSWCGSVDAVPACKPKGHWFGSQSGYMPGFQARSPLGGVREATTL